MSDEKALSRRNALRATAALFGAGALGAMSVAQAPAAEAVAIDWRSTCRNIPWSKKDVIVATGTGGRGHNFRLKPGDKLWLDTDSILIQYVRGSGYITKVNGKEIRTKGWLNTYSYFGEIEVVVTYDPDIV